MDKKKAKKISMIAAAVIAVTGAAGAIYYFVNRDKISDLATSTLAEIVADTAIPDKEYTNLDFSKAVLNIPNASKAYKFLMQESDPYTQDESMQMCEQMLFDIFNWLDKDKVKYVDASDEPVSDKPIFDKTFNEAILSCSADDNKWYECRFSTSGSFIIYEQPTVGAAMSGKAEIIHLDRGEKAPDEKYLVDGQEYSPAQALEFAENIMSESVSKYISSIDVSPTELMIIDDPDSDNYIYKIQFEYVYDGIPYFHLSLPGSLDGPYMQNGVIYMTIGSPDQVAEIYNMMGNLTAKNDGEYEDKYIKLDDAIDLASEYLAPYFKQEISEITIKYSHNSSDENDYYRAYWCFVTEVDYTPKIDYCLTGNTIFVDMQTGEVIVYDKSLSRYKSSISDALESEELL